MAAGAAITAAGRAVVDRHWRGHSAAPREILPDGSLSWPELRAMFPMGRDWVDMGAMLLTAHPVPVANEIARHRLGLDDNPVLYLKYNNNRYQTAARDAAARYLGGIGADDIALTDSTTMGVALVYAGMKLKPGQEVLTTEHDYYVTHEALRLAASRSGAPVRRIRLHEPQPLQNLSRDELTDRVIREVRPETRVIALTWVHSSTGLKLPVPAIAAALMQVNASRAPEDHVLLCVDGVHGFGVEDVSFSELGCDLLMAGCHKWLFGPRGTGIVAGTRKGWSAVTPTIPSFLDPEVFGRWMHDRRDVPDVTSAAAFTPGGFKCFEHLWALPVAFALHAAIGRARTARRTHELASQLKEGLVRIPGVTMYTPHSPDLSSGIVAFDVAGQRPGRFLKRLRRRKIVASVAPYASKHLRLTPSVRNDPDEIDAVLSAVRDIAAS